MKVLITGAFGYFGTALTRYLAVTGHEVLMAGRAPRPSAAEGVQRIRALPGVRIGGWPMSADWREADAIVHLAGGGVSGGGITDPAAGVRDNINSLANLCFHPSVRLLVASSIYVYGTRAAPLRETDECRPDTLYGQMKCVAEAVAWQRGGTALRFAHIYGVGARADFGRDGVTERLARAAVGRDAFRVDGNGRQGIDLVHIDDACEAVMFALRCKDLPRAVNIGGGAPVSVAHLARVFLGGMPPMELPVVERALDITLAREALGWAPRVTLQEGARRLIAQTQEAQG